MPTSKQSADALLDEIRRSVQTELAESLRPIVSQLSRSIKELDAVFSGKSKRRGRPPKAAAAKKRGRPRGKRSTKRAPRGALESAIKNVLKGGKPKRVSEIRTAVQKTPLFRNHDPKNLYSMITQRLALIQGVKKSAEGYAEGVSSRKSRKKKGSKRKRVSKNTGKTE